jgi:transmembrane sensor
MTTSPNPPPDEDVTERWEALARYLAGESPEEEVRELERWLAEDSRRRELLDALDARLDRLAATAPEGLDVEAALARVRSRMPQPDVVPFPGSAARPQEHVRTGSRRTLLKVAAVAGIALVGGLLWQVVRVDAPPGAALTYQTGVGQTDSVTLSDGTRLRLGPDSRLTLAAAYGEGTRDVVLAGEAAFEVVHDEALPFTVRAGSARIQDLGTAFTVRAAGDGEVRVVVTEGSVRLAGTASSAGSGVVLNAGDRGRVTGEEAPVVEPAAAADLAWTEGRLVFEDASMARVAADLRRWYGVNVRIADPALAERTLTAQFAGEPVEEVLRVIGLALVADIQMRGDTAVLSAPPGASPR